MLDEATWLAALQHADSFFPAGAAAFSWGVEALRVDGQMTSPAGLEAFIAAQFDQRWAHCDRAFLIWAHRGHRDLDGVAAIDRLADAMALPREQREGSTRAGAALLGMHERLGTPGAASFRALVRDGRACGHLSIVQGLAWAGVGLGEGLSATAAAHGFAASLVGAALRLSMISHVDAQRILTNLRPLIAGLLAGPVPELAAVGGFTPMVDIAMMRHETQAVRLFAN